MVACVDKIEMPELLCKTGGGVKMLAELDMLEQNFYRRLESLPADHIPHKNPEDTDYQVLRNVLVRGTNLLVTGF